MNYEKFVCAVEGLAKKYSQMNPNMYVNVNRGDCSLEVVCMSKQEVRQQWADEVLEEYFEEYKERSEIILSDPKRKVLVAKFEDDWNWPGYGVAKCSPDDEFDEHIGLAVAFAHFRKYPIPDFV